MLQDGSAMLYATGGWTILLCIKHAAFAVHWPASVNRFAFNVSMPFRPFIAPKDFLTADELELRRRHTPKWKTVTMSGLALINALAFIVMACGRLSGHRSLAVYPFLVALTWLYTSIVMAKRRAPTPPYGLLVLVLLHLIGTLFGVYFALLGTQPLHRSLLFFQGWIVFSCCGIMSVALTLPIVPVATATNIARISLVKSVV